VSGSGISWAICKSTPRSRQITTPAPRHSVFTGWMPFLLPIQQHQSTEGTNDNNKWYEQQISVVGCLWYHRNQSWRLENTRWFLWKRFSCCWNLVIEPRHGSQWKQESLFQAAADVVIVRSLVRLYVPWLILYLNCLLTYLVIVTTALARQVIKLVMSVFLSVHFAYVWVMTIACRERQSRS